jgi:hypothetical protein
MAHTRLDNTSPGALLKKKPRPCKKDEAVITLSLYHLFTHTRHLKWLNTLPVNEGILVRIYYKFNPAAQK